MIETAGGYRLTHRRGEAVLFNGKWLIVVLVVKKAAGGGILLPVARGMMVLCLMDGVSTYFMVET